MKKDNKLVVARLGDIQKSFDDVIEVKLTVTKTQLKWLQSLVYLPNTPYCTVSHIGGTFGMEREPKDDRTKLITEQLDLYR